MSKDNYKAVIADLEKQRAEIDQTIALLKRRAGQSASGSASAEGDNEEEIQPDTFHGKNIFQATEKYLSMVGRPARSTEEIVEALGRGGVTATAGSVATILGRDKSGRVSRVKRGLWGLKEWYNTAQ